jgi:hypothetical protein
VLGFALPLAVALNTAGIVTYMAGQYEQSVTLRKCVQRG